MALARGPISAPQPCELNLGYCKPPINWLTLIFATSQGSGRSGSAALPAGLPACFATSHNIHIHRPPTLTLPAIKLLFFALMTALRLRFGFSVGNNFTLYQFDRLNKQQMQVDVAVVAMAVLWRPAPRAISPPHLPFPFPSYGLAIHPISFNGIQISYPL